MPPGVQGEAKNYSANACRRAGGLSAAR
jgi:hypothetical protein